MGIYVFEAKFLYEQLRRDAADSQSTHDFGKDVIPYIVAGGKAVAHHFERSCVRARATTPVARRRRSRRLLGRQYRSHRFHAAARSLRPQRPIWTYRKCAAGEIRA
jgi:ADP-glucose pyrophosphorylase